MNAALLGFDLLRPAWSIALVAAPVVLLLGFLGLAARARARAKLVSARHAPRFLPRYSDNRARLRVVFGTLALLFLALGLIGPVRGYTLRDVQRKGLDLVVCVDTSRSMLVQDVKPDRLTRAKREVVGLLEKLRGDRAALLAFAGDVREVAPLTHDRATLAAFVNALNTDENLRGGTDLGVALEKALSLFDGRTGAHEAIVLLTDGEDLEKRGLEVAKTAKERGIRVYVVGMGTQEGAKIPDEGGRGFVKDETGREVVSALDGTSLAEIANLTGGAYLSVQNSPIPLEELFDKRIARLEGRDLVAGKERIPHDRFQWALVAALAFLLAEFALRERRFWEPRVDAPAVPPAGSLPARPKSASDARTPELVP
ncbi:MAG: VWA domain-containing protein [Planctomycetes bacterium]|nr:VWA domain-containing protein [Planctomycetota bacterium]